MITLAILKQMEADQVGNLTIDRDFFWEELPLQKNGEPAQGVWLVTRGGSINNTPHGINQRSTIDFYVAFYDKTKTEQKLAQIQDWLRANNCFCKLSGTVGDSRYSFTNIRIRPTMTPQNQGATSNGMIVKVASAQVYFDTNNN